MEGQLFIAIHSVLL